MSKKQLIGVSLVSAVPALGLFYLLIMALMGGFESMPIVLKVAVLVLLVVAAIGVLFPVIITVQYGRPPRASAATTTGKEAPAKASAKQEPAPAAEPEEALEADDDLGDGGDENFEFDEDEDK